MTEKILRKVYLMHRVNVYVFMCDVIVKFLLKHSTQTAYNRTDYNQNLV